MAYDPRTIAFFVELLHPPIQHDARKLQALHGELFTDQKSFYRNFAIVEGGAVYSNPPSMPNANSTACFLPDRVQVREEFTGAALDDACARLERIAGLAVSHMGIQLFTAQQCVVRSLVNPKHFRDSREFLARALFRFTQDDLQTFARPAQLLGMRFVFPRVEDKPEIYSLRLESYNGDPRSLYLENVGTFGPLLAAQGLAALSENLRSSYRFLTEEVLEFLTRFDKQEAR